MNDRKLRTHAITLLGPDFDEPSLWRSSKDTKDYLRKVQQLSSKTPPAHFSPSPKFPVLDDILSDPNLRQQSQGGIFMCRRCRTPITNYKTEQRRSADEGQTLVAKCPNKACGIHNVVNT